LLSFEGDPGTVSSRDRVSGFIKAAKGGGLNIIASQPAYWNRTKAYELAATIIKNAPNLRAIAVANDDMALGVVRGVQEAGTAGTVIVVSVDGIPEALDAVEQGLLAGTVAQYPDAMAYLAIEAMIHALKGEVVPETIDSPIKLITKDNLSEAGKYFKDE
jgi:ribose transport system substrate-binding protein